MTQMKVQSFGSVQSPYFGDKEPERLKFAFISSAVFITFIPSIGSGG